MNKHLGSKFTDTPSQLGNYHEIALNLEACFKGTLPIKWAVENAGAIAAAMDDLLRRLQVAEEALGQCVSSAEAALHRIRE